MTNLLTYSQQQLIKPFSQNNSEKYKQIADEVENFELKKLLGIKFLQAIQATPSDYSKVLDSYTFQDTNEDSLTHKGLRYVIAYFNFSKYLGMSDIADTFSGFVTKSRNESEPLSEGRIKRLQEENRQIALTEWEVIKYYLDLNYEDYPLWDSIYSKKVFRPKIIGLKKTEYGS
jgi:hypothetical protein